MTVATDTFQSFQAIGNREQLLDDIYRIDPTDTPFLTMAEKMKATAKTVEWQTQLLTAASGSNKKIEGDPFVNTAVVPTVRVGARTQISWKVAEVTRSQQAVNSAGRKSEMAYQMAMRMQELKRDMETSALQNVASSAGNATTASITGGLPTWLTSNVSRGSGGSSGGFTSGDTTVATNGTQRALTESLVKNVMLSCRTNGGKPDTLMLGAFNRQVASAFTGNATKFIDMTSNKKINATVDVYMSDFGPLKIVDNLWQAARDGFLIQSDMVGVAYLRPFQTEDVAKIADSDRKSITVEYAVVVKNQAAHGAIADLTTS